MQEDKAINNDKELVCFCTSKADLILCIQVDSKLKNKEMQF